MTNTRTASNLPYIHTGDSVDIDTLDSVETIELRGRQLREGMVLVDDLDCSIAVLDHRMARLGAAAGATEWMYLDLEAGNRWPLTVISHTARIRVAARSAF